MTATRFAPSPTGLLHLGHVYAAMVARALARRLSGEFLMRFEDIDHTRVRPEYYDACREDLEFLGLSPDRELEAQLDRLSTYQDALSRLRALGVLYPCFCTRKEIQAELSRITSAPHGPDGPHYPGTCRSMSEDEIQSRLAEGETPAWRLHAERAAEMVGALEFEDLRLGHHQVDPLLHGDVILSRKDIGTSYHLAVTVDDARDQITHVTRGEDLLPATHIHCVLQHLLELPRPLYLHHPLVVGADGKRLAKRDQPTSIRELRAEGMTCRAIFENLPAIPSSATH